MKDSKGMAALMRLIRPKQWIKNGFIFVPLFFGGALFHIDALLAGLITFFAYSFAASSIYCFNDIFDVEADRRHPVKCHRPIASGAVSIRQAYGLMFLMLALSMATCCLLESWEIMGIIAFYWLLNLCYCAKLKQYAIIDVCIVAFGFVLRLLAGGVATHIMLSKWIVLMTFLITLFMSFAKRRDDVLRMEKIINNLMSNAMKFTPRGGKIDVSFDTGTTNKGEQIITITVADTGKGIPQNEVENIFKRYYQLNNQSTGTINWGTGIGLYYARSLAVLHHGNLKAGNRKDCQGAIFTVTLPTEDSLYAANEKAPLEQDQKKAFPLHDSQKVADKISQDDSTDNRPKILIVDDDTEVVHYLRTLLASSYRIIYRFDAESALKATREEEPSLILSDVVMPGMSGYDLCKEIKQDIQLCHIPVILVTAKTTTENQVEGLNSGADAYVTKPFTPKVLLAMINSQLTNREKTKTILTNATETDKNVEEVLSPQDKLFMDELYHMMEQELANSELDVNKVTKLMHISRTKLYYKVKGLTGENPSVFFKTYKLNRAATLIVEGKYNISEIAYMTGFNTLSHFSTSFKKQFGCTPSEYSKKTY